jgi:hypothetical protein
MKNQLFMAMMVMASLLFIATGASAQYCLTCGPQGAAGVWWQQHHQEMAPAASGERQETQEFVPASPASEEMSLAREKTITGLDAAPRRTHEDYGVNYSSQFERGGLP